MPRVTADFVAADFHILALSVKDPHVRRDYGRWEGGIDRELSGMMSVKYVTVDS